MIVKMDVIVIIVVAIFREILHHSTHSRTIGGGNAPKLTDFTRQEESEEATIRSDVGAVCESV